MVRIAAVIATLLVIDGLGLCADEPKDIRMPNRFGIIFNKGYAGDNFPQSPEEFEANVVGLKQAHFNVVWCRYDEKRAEICRKHGMQIFVDLLTPQHHVYKNVEEAKKLCESLKKNETVYGYHLWSDNIGETYPGRTRDVANVHTWDPTHPTYIGTYRMSRVSRVEGLDLFGYYDFHWKRGGHWDHLGKAFETAKGKNVYFLRYCDAVPGQVGKGNPNRVGYTVATSIVFGLKGYTFHYDKGVIDPKTGELDALGKDLQKVNAAFAPLGDVLLKLGNPQAVYSTPIGVTANNEPIEEKPAVPAGLPAVPEDSWVKVTQGEVLFGLFKDKTDDVLIFASHNAYQGQNVKLVLAQAAKKVERFNREKKQWEPLQAKDKELSFAVAEASVELIRIAR